MGRLRDAALVGSGAAGGVGGTLGAQKLRSRRYSHEARDKAWQEEAHRQLRELPRGAPFGPRSLFGDKHDPYSPGYVGAPHGFKDRRKHHVNADKVHKGLVELAKASRDQNSSPGATIVRRGPVGPGQKPTRAASRGNSPGRFTPGRNERRDANSSPSVTRVQPRHPNGRYVSHEADLKVIHPKGKRISTQPKTSALGIHRKGRGSETKGWVEKAYGRANTRFGMTGTKGRRIS